MQHDLILTKPLTVTLEVSLENSQRVTTPFLQVTQTLCFSLLGWKFDDVTSLTQVRGQRVE